jgi:uncharacterized protein (UPF0335 family)
MSADGQIKSFFQRWENLEAEKKQTADALKDLFAEAKGFGYDTKALRAAFRLKVKEDFANSADAEFEAVVDTYINAINAPSVSTRDARLRTRENIEEFDPETGEILDPKLAHTVVTGMQTEIGRKALIAAVDIMIAREEAEEESVAKASGEQTEGTTGLQAAGPRREMRVGEASAHLPATSEFTDVTDRRDDHFNTEMDRATEGSFETGSVAAEKGRKAIPAGPEGVDLNHAGAGESPATEIASTAQGEVEAPSADERRSPNDGMSGEGANAGGDHVNAHPSSAATAGALVQPAPAIKHKFRPNCQHRDHCKSGTVDHCHSCKLAMREGEAA